MKLDYKKMVKEINGLVDNDFGLDMNCKLLPKSAKYTQEEAKQMADLLGKVYLISHCISCSACNGRYRIKELHKNGEIFTS